NPADLAVEGLAFRTLERISAQAANQFKLGRQARIFKTRRSPHSLHGGILALTSFMPQQPLTDTFFESFDLHPDVLSSLHASGFPRCTPIRALTLPLALQGRDVAGQAQTGTGKTGAFLVAVMNRLLTQPALPERTANDPRALIIAPTRELAIQIDKDFK